MGPIYWAVGEHCSVSEASPKGGVEILQAIMPT